MEKMQQYDLSDACIVHLTRMQEEYSNCTTMSATHRNLWENSEHEFRQKNVLADYCIGEIYSESVHIIICHTLHSDPSMKSGVRAFYYKKKEGIIYCYADIMETEQSKNMYMTMSCSLSNKGNIIHEIFSAPNPRFPDYPKWRGWCSPKRDKGFIGTLLFVDGKGKVATIRRYDNKKVIKLKFDQISEYDQRYLIDILLIDERKKEKEKYEQYLREKSLQKKYPFSDLK